MDRFAQLDTQNLSKPGGVVFTGSSSIRLWNLQQSFPRLRALNRGFGGSQLADVNSHLDRLVLRHKPSIVVLYAGDNDLAEGKTPEQVRDDFVKFVAGVRENLPDTKIIYISIKPSIKRWSIADKIREANAKIAATCRSTDKVEFIDVWPAMLNEEGMPRAELFQADGLHMNERGYARWKDLLADHLPENAPTGR